MLLGLLGTFTLSLAGCRGEDDDTTYTPRTRTYYIAADEVEWDYAPQGENVMANDEFDEDEQVFVVPGPERIGSIYIKSLYREYTDDTFTELKPIAPEWEHLGTLGPTIRGVVGDTIELVFYNNTRYPVSVHPHGVFYGKDSEGTPYDDGTAGSDKADDSVTPGDIHTYVWEVEPRAGPGPADPSSVVWLYHSHTDEPSDTNAGLIGPIIITAAAYANDDATPNDVDREFVTLFTVYDENESNYLDDNIARYLGEDPATFEPSDPDDFDESNLMHTINGYVFGNLPMMTMHVGDRTRWYLLAMGTEVDLHTPHWHGSTVVWDGHAADVIELVPASTKMADMIPDNPGIWMYHCHVNDHLDAGMIARYEILP